MANLERRKEARPEDLAKATLVTVTNNIGAIVRMLAMISVSFIPLCCPSISVFCVAGGGEGHLCRQLPLW